MPTPKNVILKGVITNLSLDPNGDAIATVSSMPTGAQPMPAAVPYRFEPYIHVMFRASDLGNSPLGATVEVEVRLS